MYAHLNACTRRVVEQLMAGGKPIVGGEEVPAMSDDERRLLHVLATKLNSLAKGAELVKQIEKELSAILSLPDAKDLTSSLVVAPPTFWRFGRLKAYSFRGLAPAGHEWPFDFNGQSCLFHGGNGSGKSSLMGAVAWCLTGQLFRDDCEPCAPQPIEIYTTDDRAKAAGTRPCALALTDAAGANTSADAPFWVELELLPNEGNSASTPIWIRRHRSDGLSTSLDGVTWRKISTVDEIGISELDTELHVLMPARVPHLRFGKTPELVRLFAQVVGLDDLEAIAEGAKSVHAAFTRTANTIEKDQLVPLRQQVDDLVHDLDALAPSVIKSMTGYAAATGATRALSDVAQLGTSISERLNAQRRTLASSLGLSMPGVDGADDATFVEQLKLLPGQVQACVTQLERPLDQLFPSVLQAGQPSPDELEVASTKLSAFVESAVRISNDRAKWAKRESTDPALQAMLAAAAQYDESDDQCPVCLRPMAEVPDRRSTLLDLKSLKDQAHLKREVEDLETGLIAELRTIVSHAHAARAQKSMSQRVQDDWTKLKSNACSGLLLQLAERLDDRITSTTLSSAASASVSERAAPVLPTGFQRLAGAIADAKGYLVWARGMNAELSVVRAALERVVRSDPSSLRATVEMGRTLSDEIGTLGQAHQLAGRLWKALKLINDHNAHVQRASAMAAAAGPIKDLGDLARKEAFDVVKRVDPEVKEYYARLYGNEVLELNLITSGHAANRNIKTEINAYFKVGKERVPIGPFSNAGRLRGIMLSFVFALLKHSRNSIGLIVLDDPALSMDDEHKTRFLDDLIAPVMADRQVVLATHYESFFKAAETHFRSGERFNVVPKRSRSDAVNFEPADLLVRLEQFLSRPTSAWREAGNNLRLWAERTLAALSAYAPDPFVVFNNVPATVAAYKAIVDDRVATERRDRIVAALESPVFERVRNACAHDEEPIENDVRDALKVLKESNADVDFELKRLKTLHRHSVLGRGLGRRPYLESLPIQLEAPPMRLAIEARAAAATGGAGIEWLESSLADLPRLPLLMALDDALAPTCSRGNILIMDSDDAGVSSSDLVAVQTEDGHRYARRFWADERGVQLEATNPTMAFEPVFLGTGKHRIRKIAGVLFDGYPVRSRRETGKEWTAIETAPPNLLNNVIGVRVVGASLQPLASEGQIVLVRKQSVTTVSPGALACVDIDGGGVVLKRCYPLGAKWVLNPLNLIDVIDPIVVDATNLRHVYPVLGVLFSVRLESERSVITPRALAS